jgi:hypothetical protein
LKVQTTLETLNIPAINYALTLLIEVKMKKYCFRKSSQKRHYLLPLPSKEKSPGSLKKPKMAKFCPI